MLIPKQPQKLAARPLQSPGGRLSQMVPMFLIWTHLREPNRGAFKWPGDQFLRLFGYNFLFLLSFLCGPIGAFALYNGNSSLPMMPESGAFIPREAWVGVKVGYEFDFVYDRRLRMQGQHLDHCNKKVHKYDSLSNFGVLTLNFSDRVEIFSTLGVMSCELSHTTFANAKITYRTDNVFA